MAATTAVAARDRHGRDHHVGLARVRPVRRPTARAAPPPPSASPVAATAAARSTDRTTTCGLAQPSCTSAATAEAAVAPPPSTTARSARATPLSASARTSPSTSVLSPTSPPEVNSTVLTEPVASAVGDCRPQQRLHQPLERHRQRQARPRVVARRRRNAAAPRRHRPRRRRTATPSARATRTRRGAAPATASARSGCRAPRRAGRVIAPSALAGVVAAPLAELGDVALVLGRRRRELRLAGRGVDRDEVQPRPGRGLQRTLDGRLAGVVDRAGWQAAVPVGVVRRVDVALGRGGGDACACPPRSSPWSPAADAHRCAAGWRAGCR